MKILMTLMGLEIGGAETHVVELSKELRARGYDIVVASSGGVYERELEKSGIRHVTLPLHTKSPSALIKSYKGLERLISREKFDIVCEDFLVEFFWRNMIVFLRMIKKYL